MVPFLEEYQVNARFRRKADGIPNVASHADVLEKTPTLGSAFQSFYQFKKQDRARKCLSELFDCLQFRIIRPSPFDLELGLTLSHC